MSKDTAEHATDLEFIASMMEDRLQFDADNCAAAIREAASRLSALQEQNEAMRAALNPYMADFRAKLKTWQDLAAKYQRLHDEEAYRDLEYLRKTWLRQRDQASEEASRLSLIIQVFDGSLRSLSENDGGPNAG